MRTPQQGFIGILFVLIVTLLLIGGGAYVYTNNTEETSPESYQIVENTSSESVPIDNIDMVTNIEAATSTVASLNTEVKNEVPEQTKKAKLFTQNSGVFSVNYPDTWTYVESKADLRTRFQTRTGQILIGMGTDMEYVVKSLSYSMTPQKITFGQNVFTKFVRTEGARKGEATYIFPVGVVDNESMFLSILVSANIKADTSDFGNFMSSIKVSPAKAVSAIVSEQIDTVTKAQINSNVMSISSYADLYYYVGKTYVGMCDITNKNAIDSGIDKVYQNILKIVAPTNVYCNVSTNAYVYSVRVGNGESICSDSTGFSGTITSNTRALSCK